MEETTTKSVHRKTALKKGDFGSIQCWGFNDSYIFLNFDKEKLEHIKSLDEVDILSKEDSDRLWKEKDVRIKDKDGNEKRPLQKAVFKLRGTTSKTGRWMMDFCNEIGNMNSVLEMYKRLVSMYGKQSMKKMKKEPAFQQIAMECLMGGMRDFSVSDRAFDESLSEGEILEVIGKFKSLPKDWRKDYKSNTKEMAYYMNKAEPIELKIQSISDEEKKNVFGAEQAFIKNVEEETLKLEFNGHAPYGGIYNEIKREIERRDGDNGISADSVFYNQLIGKKFYKDGDGCYYCGSKLGYQIKDENTVEYFMWERGEEYKDKTEIDGRCSMEEKDSRIHEFEITIPTGEVVIDNYFLDNDGEYLFDVPEDEQYSDKYTLQTLKGRFNRQDYLSKTHNLGYAQMGNMSMDVFVSKDGKKLIFGTEPYDWYDEEDEEYSAPTKKDKAFNDKFEKEWTNLGNISLSVWRWECADKKTLTDAGHSGEGEVVAKVVPGTYTVRHLYGSVNCEKNTNRYMTYSEITLKK